MFSQMRWKTGSMHLCALCSSFRICGGWISTGSSVVRVFLRATEGAPQRSNHFWHHCYHHFHSHHHHQPCRHCLTLLNILGRETHPPLQLFTGRQELKAHSFPNSCKAENPKERTREEKPLSSTMKRVQKNTPQGFPGGAVVKNPPANAGDTGSSPGPGRSHVPRSS